MLRLSWLWHHVQQLCRACDMIKMQPSWYSSIFCTQSDLECTNFASCSMHMLISYFLLFCWHLDSFCCSLPTHLQGLYRSSPQYRSSYFHVYFLTVTWWNWNGKERSSRHTGVSMAPKRTLTFSPFSRPFRPTSRMLCPISAGCSLPCQSHLHCWLCLEWRRLHPSTWSHSLG